MHYQIRSKEVKTDCIIYFGTSHWNFRSFSSDCRLHVSLLQIEVIDSIFCIHFQIKLYFIEGQMFFFSYVSLLKLKYF